jgi:hypothetical protein
MKLLAKYIDFNYVGAKSATILLCSSLPLGQVSIGKEDYQYFQITMKTIINGSRCGMDNTSKYVAMERQRCVVL